MFTMQTREPWLVQHYVTLHDAINAGMALKSPETGKCVPFDVLNENGVILWAFEMRA